MSKYSNYCMLAYGITGAGKTFTLEGEANRSHSLRPERERADSVLTLSRLNRLGQANRSHSLRPERERELTVCSHSRD
jgi:hypothetical protein